MGISPLISKIHIMEVSHFAEYGYEHAMRGLGKSFKADKDMHERAVQLAGKGNGEDKFRDFLIIYFDLLAPRYIWSEFDTYAVGVRKQSESTMHTLAKEIRSMNSPEDMYVAGLCEPGSINQDCFSYMKQLAEKHAKLKDRAERGETLSLLKRALPEGWLQSRTVLMNYTVLERIVRQRHNHLLPHWRILINELYSNIKYKEFIKWTPDQQ